MRPPILRPMSAASIALVCLIFVFATAAAQDATPASRSSRGFFGCTTEPPPRAELRGFVERGYRVAAAAMADYYASPATPSAEGSAVGVATPPAAVDQLDPAAFSGARPADKATAAAATETLRQFAACFNAGRLTAAMSLVPESAAEWFLGFGAYSFVRFSPGMAEPPAEINPILIEAYLATTAIPVPTLPWYRIDLREIGEVLDLGDGRVAVVAVAAIGTEPPKETSFLMRHEDGRFVILIGPDEAAIGPTAVATPVS